MIVKEILSGDIRSINSIRISSFKPKGLKQMLSTLPQTLFVLGVGYDKGDYQICISGRKKINEKISHTINREMYEELSLVPKFPVSFVKTDNNYFSKVNIRDTILLPPDLFRETSSDDTKERAIICVYGNFTQVMRYMSEVKGFPENNDSITHIWADTIQNIRSYI
jgi:hypothetical protein